MRAMVRRFFRMRMGLSMGFTAWEADNFLNASRSSPIFFFKASKGIFFISANFITTNIENIIPRACNLPDKPFFPANEIWPRSIE